jgi:zinc/manganese transport system substrate-binding protein
MELTMMKRMITVMGLIFFMMGWTFPVLGSGEDDKLHVITTLSFLKYLAEEVGGDQVKVHNLSNPNQDPHYVQPRPTLMKMAREADLFIEVGLQLELWSQKVVDGSANPAIQLGQPGRVVTSTGISTLELPQVLSREWGDIHPYGNPHVWLDPVNTRKMAENIARSMAGIDPGHADLYMSNLKDFQKRIDVALYGRELVEEVGVRKLSRLISQGRLRDYLETRGLEEKLKGWLKKGEKLRGKRFVTYHKTWIYFAGRFGLEIPVEIEEKPGITPSARHRERVIRLMKSQGIGLIVISSFYDRSAADYISKETGATVLSLPIDISAVGGVETYFDLIDYYLDAMLGVLDRSDK